MEQKCPTQLHIVTLFCRAQMFYLRLSASFLLRHVKSELAKEDENPQGLENFKPGSGSGRTFLRRTLVLLWRLTQAPHTKKH